MHQKHHEKQFVGEGRCCLFLLVICIYSYIKLEVSSCDVHIELHKTGSKQLSITQDKDGFAEFTSDAIKIRAVILTEMSSHRRPLTLLIQRGLSRQLWK